MGLEYGDNKECGNRCIAAAAAVAAATGWADEISKPNDIYRSSEKCTVVLPTDCG